MWFQNYFSNFINYITFINLCYSVEKKKNKEPERDTSQDDQIKKKPKISTTSSAPKANNFNYKNITGSSQLRFGILTKIVQYMKSRHLEGDLHPLTLDEIMDETNQLDVKSKVEKLSVCF